MSTKSQVYGVRLEAKIVDALDRAAESLVEKTQLRVSRADVIRRYLLLGLKSDGIDLETALPAKAKRP